MAGQAQVLAATPDLAWQAALDASIARDRAIGEAEAGIAEAAGACKTHRNRTIACAVAGALLAPVVGAFCSWIVCGIGMVPEEKWFLMFFVFAISGFLLAYALCFIWNSVKNHGFFIIFSLPFLTACLGILAVVTIPGGLAYAIWNISKSRKAKESKALWEQRLASLVPGTAA